LDNGRNKAQEVFGKRVSTNATAFSEAELKVTHPKNTMEEVLPFHLNTDGGRVKSDQTSHLFSLAIITMIHRQNKPGAQQPRRIQIIASPEHPRLVDTTVQAFAVFNRIRTLLC